MARCARTFVVFALVALLLATSLTFLSSDWEPGSAGLGTSSSSVGPPSIVRDLVAPAYVSQPGLPELGPLPADQDVTVLVGLSPPDPAAWSALLELETTPGSSQYRHFLTAPEFQARFAPSSLTYWSAVDYFTGYGLEVTTSPDRLILEASGPAASVGQAFGTQFEAFGTPEHWFYSHVTDASLPAIAPWSGVLGLGNETPIGPAPLAAVPTAVAGSSYPASTGTGCPSPGGAYEPCQIEGAYNETPLLENGTNGTGYRIGIVDRYDGSEPQSRLASDLAKFDSTFGLPAGSVDYLYPVPTTKNLNATTTGWGLEETLDLEWAHAVAPGASIDMTFAPDASAGLYAAVDWLVARQSVNVISLSWGEPDVGVFNDAACSAACNATSDGTYALLHPVLMEAALEGITVLAASGDCGAADGTNGVSTNYPASDPWVTGVGGTVLSVTAHDQYDSEVGWGGNVSGTEHCSNQGGSGGGFSPFPRPFWQTGPGVPPQPEVRGVPDVAADAGYPVVVVQDGESGGVEGTSVATPVWAGFTAVADNASGSALGFLDPALYSVLRSAAYPRALHNVTQGWNGYDAGPGWNPVTGIGSPNLNLLVPLLSRSTLSPANFSVELFAESRTGPAPLDTTFNVSVQGGAGDYPLEDVSFGDGTAALVTGGRVSHVYATPGVYAAQAVVFDAEGNSSISPLTAIVVGGGNALNVTLNSSAARPALDASVTFEASVAGASGTLRYDFSFGDGTYLNNTTKASVLHSYGASGGYCASVVVSDSGTPPSGGSSNRVAETAGKGPSATCTPWVRLRATLTSPFVAGDLPGDFPIHVSAVGGAGPVQVQYVSDDPYVTACQCSVFRTPGEHRIIAYVNDSLNQGVRTQLNVTVYPALNASFSASTLSGTAPLNVTFEASVSGGNAANASQTLWQFGDGTHTTGAIVRHTYESAGLYRVVASLRDDARGNASEVFLLDVSAAGSASTLRVTATLWAEFGDLPGATLRTMADLVGGSGSYTVRWSFGAFASAYGTTVNESLPTAGCLATRTCPLDVNLTVADGAGSVVETEIPLGLLDVGRVTALNWTDSVRSTNGTTPYLFSASANATGLPTWSLGWAFGDGAIATGTEVEHTYLVPGNYTVVETATDRWGDELVRTHAVTVQGAPIAPLTVSGGPDSPGGVVPWTVAFNVSAGGGGGGPYTYLWDFGDGNASTIQNPTHTYTRAAVYDASVLVQNALGVTEKETYELAAYDPVPVDLVLHVPGQVLAGDSVPVQITAAVSCPAVAPAGCNVSEVAVVVALGSASSASASGTVRLPGSGSATVDLAAPVALGTEVVSATVVGPDYVGSAHASVQLEFVTVVPAVVIGIVVGAAVAGVLCVGVRRRRRGQR